VRRRRSEILAELPSRTDTTVPVEITPSQLLAHERLSPRIAELVSLAKQRTLSPAERLMLISLLTKQRVIANGMAQLEFESVWPRIASRPPRPDLLAQLFAPKLIEMQRIIEAFVIEQERKVVVFSQWRRMIRLVAWATRDILRDAGLRSVFFTGKESLRQRDRSIVDIHDDPWTRVLFATDCAGVGLNLQRAATVCVHVELPWNPAIFEQRVARLHRLGQTQPIDVVSLVTLGSIESRIATVVGAKQAVFDGLFDSDVDSILFEDRSEDWVVAENEDEEGKEEAA
jgi:SNF2 family DNA or RNA helicase